jgi:hypothetical protein
MSLHHVSQSIQYPLPANAEAVPESFKSNRQPRPINSQVSTVYVPAITGSQSEGGVSTLQIPLSSSAGYICNPYLTWKVQIAGGTNTNRFGFSGPSGLCSALINSVQVSINGQQIDNLNNFDQLVDLLFTHASSADFVSHDAEILMHAASQYAVNAGGVLAAGALSCVCPLPGSLGSAGQAFPASLLQGSMTITINWNSIARALYMRNAANDGAGVAPTGLVISDVALVYDKVMPEMSFLEMVRNQLASGNKYIYSYTAYQTSTQQTNGASTATYSLALNRSSLRGVAMTQVPTADLTSATANKASVNNSLSAFEVSLDGRRVNSVPLNTTTQPALCFAESQKVFSKLFDPSVSDVVSNGTDSLSVQGGTYLSGGFFIACSCLRTNEPLAFAGSPVSVSSIQYTVGATASTQFFHFISDEQMAISADGSVELLR